jgi:glycosyltransferase involved in cell wall biosynthesis
MAVSQADDKGELGLSNMASPDGRRALCDFWYVRELPDMLEPANALSPISRPRGLKQKLVSAFGLFRQARGRKVVVPHWYEYGPLYLVLAALRRDANVVLLEFIDLRLDSMPPPVRRAYDLFARSIIAPAMRSSVVAIQVMTPDEAEAVARRYRFDRSRIRVIPWPLSGWDAGDAGKALPEGTPYAFSSGRTACDWETLFVAAKGADWRLRVVCAAADLQRVRALNADGRAEVLSEIPLEEHDRLLRSASVYVLPLTEMGKSAGQVRLGTAISLGVPVVASDISGLDGYLADGVTGIAVPPGDAPALRAALDRLMRDDTARQALADRAREEAASYGRAEYFAAVGELVRSAAEKAIASRA